jgi:hypothetical protein
MFCAIIKANGGSMKIKKMGLFLALWQFSLVAVDMPHSNSLLTQLSRQCIKIWCLISNLVDNNDTKDNSVQKQAEPAVVESLDTLLCRIMKVRDTLSHCSKNPVSDTQTAHYIDSSLDCIGQYTYDLVAQYPGNWSTIIQEQVFRTQEAYAHYLVPLLPTK